MPPVEGFERARVAAQHALNLNPRSGMAHSTLAAINLIYDWDWAAAIRESEHALALNPHNAQAIEFLVIVQRLSGFWSQD